jgi:hypothetical protein
VDYNPLAENLFILSSIVVSYLVNKQDSAKNSPRTTMMGGFSSYVSGKAAILDSILCVSRLCKRIP